MPPATALASDAHGAAGMRPEPVPRLVSLDAFRGFIMFWIIGGGALMAGLRNLGHNPVIDTIVYQLSHTPWQGLRFYDIIWPCFMLMVGVSVPFSLAKAALTQTRSQLLRKALTRAAVLFLLGSLRESVSLNSPYWVELSSALQPIAIAYLAAFFLARTSIKVQAAVGGLILVGYAALLAFVGAPGVPAGSYAKEANLVLAVDLAVLGRAHAEGWGTVLSTLPTISTTILGLILGEVLRSERPRSAKFRIIAFTGLCGVVLGFLLNPVIPIVMKLWTTSYGIATAGWACLLFALFYWFIDVAGFRRWAFPLVVIGMNAVAVYMAGTLFPLGHIVGIFTRAVSATLEPLVRAVAVLAVEWLVLYWMWRRKIFLKA
jgi:predicted acyltransferase